MTDTPGLALLLKEVQHAIVHITLAEVIHAASTQRVKQIIIDIVNLQLAERTVVHGQRILARRIREVGQLRRHIVRLARMALQSYTRSSLRLALHIYWRCVEEIHTMLYGIIHKTVHGLLVDDVPIAIGIGYGGPSHASITEQRNLVLAQSRKTTVCHLVCGNRTQFT